MSEKTVLLVDDSATIRRLVDTELSAAGYRVILAATAEEGLDQARMTLPDLIILDHQLPGTTGFNVCTQLLANPKTAAIPVVASSTLRKKAYSEYVDCPNVVDMLPKPYTADVLKATVENAIDTAALVVQSQNQGSSVPEVIDELGETDLSGGFNCFGLREVIDFLNNGSKCGALEIESDKCRVYIYLENGRIQAVTASGIDVAEVARQMPSSLAELTPVIKFTVSGRRGTEVDGMVELIDNKVLDPRLLKKLLRLQAAILLRTCYSSPLKSFRFDHGQQAPSLFRKLPLDISQLGLLVEGALNCSVEKLPTLEPHIGYVRKAIRGQNLDRAGLSSSHMKLLSVLSEPASVNGIAKRLGWSEEETRRVLHGFELAELVERRQIQDLIKLFAVAPSTELHERLASTLNSIGPKVSGKLLRDWLSLGLLLRRQKPDVLLVDLRDESAFLQLQRIKHDPAGHLSGVRVIGLYSDELGSRLAAASDFVTALRADYDEQELIAAVASRSFTASEEHGSSETGRESNAVPPFQAVAYANETGFTAVS